jgi:hypothetical protein
MATVARLLVPLGVAWAALIRPQVACQPFRREPRGGALGLNRNGLQVRFVNPLETHFPKIRKESAVEREVFAQKGRATFKNPKARIQKEARLRRGVPKEPAGGRIRGSSRNCATAIRLLGTSAGPPLPRGFVPLNASMSSKPTWFDLVGFP